MAKRTIAAALLTLSMSSFALDNIGVHQSYYVTEKGRPITVKSEIPADGSGWATTFSPDEFFYQKDIVDTFGGNYIVMDTDGIIHTLDSQGNMYKELDAYADSRVKVAGMNYFITSKGTIVVIKHDGMIGKTEAGFERVNKKEAGGMYFFHKRKLMIPNIFTGDNVELPYSTSRRKAEKNGILHIDGDIEIYGDSYFVTEENKIYTIGFKWKKVIIVREDEVRGRTRRTEELQENYFPEIHEHTLPGSMSHEDIVKKGGNYFFDKLGNLFTISDKGELKRHGTIAGKAGQLPSQLGGNYMIFSDKSLYQVDEKGELNFVHKIDPKVNVLVTNK